MSNTDRSSSAITRARHNKALASFYTLNPGIRQSVYQGTGGQENSAKVVGLSTGLCCTPAVSIVLCNPPGPITNFLGGDASFPPNIYPSGGSGNVGDPLYYDVSWNPVPGATSYIITSTNEDLSSPIPPDSIVSTGATSARILLINNDSTNRIFTVTAQTACGNSSATLTVTPCFLAGSLVQMADGSTKVIEEVAVGDWVLGAFGEINEVLALHRPLLGPVATMCLINEEHSTTNHHPHISVDRQFYCGDPALVASTTYGREHNVIDGEGAVVKRLLHGLKKGRVQTLIKGINLKTVEGSRTVESIGTYAMPPETQLYNLVIGGSHTYHVDGYAVTGWPREDDFDYDSWTKIDAV